MASLTACASGPDPTERLPPKHQSSWRLPLDSYGWTTVDVAEQAENVLIGECFAKEGRAVSYWRIHESTGPGESWNSARRKLFDGDLAKKYGYGNSFELDMPLAEIRRMRDADAKLESALRASPDSLFDSCLKKSRSAVVGKGAIDPYEFAQLLGGVAFDDAYASKPVLDAAKAWAKCMQTVGVPDLPSSPREMPSPSIDALRPSGIDVVTPDGEETNVPPEERRVAVADAKCQVSSGYAAAAYDAEWDAQAAALSANADELERYKVEADKRVDRAKKILAEHSATR